jgi:hypothetical protein
MARRAAIRLEGQDAERRFIDLVPDARESDKAKKGDAIVSLDGLDSYVEIKECHAAATASGTINQVRAIKYICCVIWAPNHGSWYVISPDQLVGVAATKPRGQHTEIPFESMNFGLRSLPDDLHTKCSDDELGEVVGEAIRRGRKRTDVAELLERLLGDIVSLKERYREEVLELL